MATDFNTEITLTKRQVVPQFGGFVKYPYLYWGFYVLGRGFTGVSPLLMSFPQPTHSKNPLGMLLYGQAEERRSSVAKAPRGLLH